MSIFQKSVVNKYLKNLDESKVRQAFERFNTFYGNKLRLHNIVQLKEENYQEGFLREIFVNVLGYKISPDIDFNLTTEFKNQTDSKKADGAILKNGHAIGVIELKSTKTAFIESITKQAFNYKNNHANCRYVITSNFHDLRFYIDNSTEYEEFDLFKLSFDEFKYLYLLLSCESIFDEIPLKLKDETKFHEEDITNKFYNDYKQFRDKIYHNLVINNPEYDKLTLFKKTQKLLDRFIFVWFAEDCGLVAPNLIANTIQKWKILLSADEYFTLFSRFQKAFHHLNVGYTFQNTVYPAFNGGLFKKDEIIDSPNLKIDDEVLLDDCLKISAYDFSTDLDVNILGHIFEHSLNETDEIAAELNDEILDKTTTKRKKDGIFYTPQYITQYIVENTVGVLCDDKKKALNINEIQINENVRKNNKITKQGKELFESLQQYKKWLINLKILDPACGSGAFLNQALEFLISEHNSIDEIIAELTGDSVGLFETDKSILENNIFGVDINEESVEIAKLSLWLRTAKKDRTLSDLNNNIKCGNSIIDNFEIAGDKYFNWVKEFSEIMQNGGFDVVIGNPPYGAEMSKEQTDYLDVKYSNYKSSTKNSAIYFIYQALALTKETGAFAFIVPKSLCYSNGWNSCAGSLLPSLTKLIDTGKAFKNVLLEQVIFICLNSSNQNHYKTGICEIDEVVELESTNKEIFKKFSVLIAGNSVSEISIIEKITKNRFQYGDFVSIQRGLNWQAKAQLNQGEVPIYRGAQLDRFYLNKASECIDLSKFNINDYSYQLKPKILNQLAIAHVLNPFPHFYLQSFLDIENRLVFETISCTFPKYENIDLYFLLGLNNSKFFSWILYKFIYSNAIRSTRFDEKYVGRIPVPDFLKIDTGKIAENAKQILESTNKLKNSQFQFISILKSNFKLQSVTNKLESFYNSDFNSFLLELKKQKIEIELKKQVEWISFFNHYKQIINQLQNDIQQCDKEIDKLIYDLYELTPSEISIIEGRNSISNN